MKTCYLCSRDLSTPYNLRRHIKLCHNKASPLNVSEMKRVDRWLDSNIGQTGAGGVVESESDVDGRDETSDSSSVASTTTEVGSVESEDPVDDNWVFQRFFDEITRDVDGADSLSLRKYQKLFRERYVNFL